MKYDIDLRTRLPAELHAKLTAQVKANLFPSLNSAIIHYCVRGIQEYEGRQRVEAALRLAGAEEALIAQVMLALAANTPSPEAGTADSYAGEEDV